MALPSLAGCLEPGADTAETGSLALRMLLRNTGEGTREGGVGPHCATARNEGDLLVVEQDSTSADRGVPVLVVDSSHEWTEDRPWMSVGTEGFAIPMRDGQAVAQPTVDGVAVTVATVSWDGDGPVAVDGAAVTLPHEWTYSHPSGAWEADLRLEEGPRRVEWRWPVQRSCA